MFTLTKSPIDTESLRAGLSDDRAGALVEFEGRVRNHNEGCAVLTLEYQAAESLAQAEAKRIFAEVKEKYAIYDAVCVHREGLLAIGDTAVYVGVLSAHRGEAFDACRYIIDEIKHRLPIWKKETYTDGRAEWVNCQHVH